MKAKQIICTLFPCLLLAQSVTAQGLIERVTDFFEFEIGKRKNLEDTTLFVTKVVISPVATYEPSTSLGLGVGAKLLFKPDKAGLDTRTSNIPISIIYTLRNQLIFYSGYTIFFDEERYLLKGNLLYSNFPLKYYGIGSQTIDEDALEISYQNVLIEPLLLKRVGEQPLFIGGGLRYNVVYDSKLSEEYDGIPVGSSLQDRLGSTSVGIEAAITYDSRDNVLNAQKGNFAEFTHGFYPEYLGSTSRFMLSKLDYRQYHRVSKLKPNVIAWQAYARISWQETPELELSTLGGSERLRGFQDGRYRDKLALFTQAEYRWQTWERVGLVFFAGAGEVSPDIETFRVDRLKYTLGSGIRIKIIPSENLNIRFDYGFGFGPENDNNFYLGIAEAF